VKFAVEWTYLLGLNSSCSCSRIQTREAVIGGTLIRLCWSTTFRSSVPCRQSTQRAHAHLTHSSTCRLVQAHAAQAGYLHVRTAPFIISGMQCPRNQYRTVFFSSRQNLNFNLSSPRFDLARTKFSCPCTLSRTCTVYILSLSLRGFDEHGGRVLSSRSP
jgi:hypothetical protein